MNHARISVIMGIYNSADTLPDAIESLLSQTYTDFNLIMCDDCSTDKSAQVAAKYVEKYPDKMILIKNSQNLGLNITLNRCLNEANGEYIARMDADDISLPERFETEVKALDDNPELAFVGSNAILFDYDGNWGEMRLPEAPQPLDFLRNSPYCHGSCMIRKSAYEQENCYCVSKKLLRVEDWDLWVRMYADGLYGKNLQTPLYKFREDKGAYSRRKFRYRFNEARVSRSAVRLLKLNRLYYIYSIRPIIIGLIPTSIYKTLHRKSLKRGSRND